MPILQKIIIILGPTASGKSDLAVELARKFNGEIISADSRQVYKGINIGTGKITPDTKNSLNFSTGQAKKESKIFKHKGIIHYLIDVVSPKTVFTVADFKKQASKKIKDILKSGKIPIICGGTGFYIQSIVDNIIIPKVKPNIKLRKQLEKKTANQLFKILKKLDSKRAKNIDPKNPRRLIRAIEIAKSLGKVPSLKAKNPDNYEFLQIGIKLPEKKLKQKIEKRIKKMIENGLVKETEKLKKSGLSQKRIYELGFEYKYPAMFLQEKINKDEMLEKMIQENCQYSKRQMTWFKRDKRIHWLSAQKQAEKLVKKFI